jgi:hypothetical protein
MGQDGRVAGREELLERRVLLFRVLPAQQMIQRSGMPEAQTLGQLLRLSMMPAGGVRRIDGSVFAGVRGIGILRSSRLQSSPPQQTRPVAIEPLSETSLGTKEVRGDYIRRENSLRAVGPCYVTGDCEFPCPIGPGQSQLLGRLVSSKEDAPRRVVQAEGDPLLRRGALLALSASYVKGR